MKFNKFKTGINYWASHAGIYMWRDWDEKTVASDLKKLANLGMNVLRVFPLWSDFQPIDILTGYANAYVECSINGEFIDNTNEAVRNGFDEKCLNRFADFCKIANQFGFKIVVSLITGWMSGRCFTPSALRNKDLITDPFSVMWETKFVKYFVKRFKDVKNIYAWELGNECNCLQKDVTPTQAYNWTSQITNAIKSIDNTRPVISGMHSLLCGDGFNLSNQAELCDILTIHPYHLFTPRCDLDSLYSPRAIEHLSAELTMYHDLGKKPCFVEEIGTLGSINGNDKLVGKFVNASLFNAWAHGSDSMLHWTAFDQNELNYAPYDWCDVERYCGLLTSEGKYKEAAYTYQTFIKLINSLPFVLPERKRNFVCVTSDWDVGYGAFMLAKRAGLEPLFISENDKPVYSDFYLIPNLENVSFIKRRYFDEILKNVNKGATVLITYNGGQIGNFENLVGCLSNGIFHDKDANFVIDGQNIVIKRNAYVKLTPQSAKVLIKDSSGLPLLTVNKIGKGKILFFNAPLEKFFVSASNVSMVNTPYEKIYDVAFKESKARRYFIKNNPFIDITFHPIDKNSALMVAINNSSYVEKDKIAIPGYNVSKTYFGCVSKNGEIVIDGGDAIIFLVRKKL